MLSCRGNAELVRIPAAATCPDVTLEKHAASGVHTFSQRECLQTCAGGHSVGYQADATCAPCVQSRSNGRGREATMVGCSIHRTLLSSSTSTRYTTSVDVREHAARTVLYHICYKARAVCARACSGLGVPLEEACVLHSLVYLASRHVPSQGQCPFPLPDEPILFQLSSSPNRDGTSQVRQVRRQR